MNKLFKISLILYALIGLSFASAITLDGYPVTPKSINQSVSYFETNTAIYKILERFTINITIERDSWQGSVYKLIKTSHRLLKNQYCFGPVRMDVSNSMEKADYTFYFVSNRNTNKNSQFSEEPNPISPIPFPFGMVFENDVPSTTRVQPSDLSDQLKEIAFGSCSESLQRLHRSSEDQKKQRQYDESVNNDQSIYNNSRENYYVHKQQQYDESVNNDQSIYNNSRENYYVHKQQQYDESVNNNQSLYDNYRENSYLSPTPFESVDQKSENNFDTTSSNSRTPYSPPRASPHQ